MNSKMDITNDPVPSLIRQIAVPACIGFMANTFFNVTDTYFAGMLADQALAALALSFPIFFLILTIGSGFAAGATALIANSIGKKDEDRSIRFQTQAITLSLLSLLLVSLPLWFALESMFRFFGAEGETLRHGMIYMQIIMFGGPFFVCNQILNAGLSARGNTKVLRNFLIIGVILNVILDRLFVLGVEINGVMVIPRLEVGGIALATVSIQFVGVFFMLWHSRKAGSMKGAGIDCFIPNRTYFGELLSQCLPPLFNMLSISLGVFVINYFISRFGDNALAAYGVGIRIEQLALVPTIGLGVALGSIVGQNNGAGKLDRVNEAYRTSIKYGIFVMLVVLTPVLIFARQLVNIFNNEQEIVSMAVSYLYIQGITFYSYIAMSLSNSVLQGIKKPKMIFYIGFYRQILAPAIIYSLFSYLWQINGIWWGMVVVNWSAALFTLIYTGIRLKEATQQAKIAEQPTPVVESD